MVIEDSEEWEDRRQVVAEMQADITTARTRGNEGRQPPEGGACHRGVNVILYLMKMGDLREEAVNGTDLERLHMGVARRRFKGVC